MITYKGAIYSLRVAETKTCHLCGEEIPLSKWRDHQAEEAKKRKTRRCEVCGEDIPLKKWEKHQYSLAGVGAVLCKGMNPAKRRFYEKMSSNRLQALKSKAKSLGYTEPDEIERYLQSRGFGGKKKGPARDVDGDITKKISVPQKW